MFNPGSDEALKRGCICNPENNKYGKGHIVHGGKEPLFFKEPRCALHGPEATISDLSKAMEKSYDER